MASIAYALQRINTNPLEVLDPKMIERVCRECGHEWRARDLDPATTVALFCQQVTRGNLSCSRRKGDIPISLHFRLRRGRVG